MAYQVFEEGGFSVIHLSGEIDLSNSPDVRRLVLDTLAQDRNSLVDLSAVTYIDSSGVASLVEGYQTARNRGLRFGLVNVSAAALSVLQLAHLDKVFPIQPSVQAFLGSDA
jgi:anti-sigma B factor antagonist